MPVYSFLLRNEKRKAYIFLSWLITVMQAVALIFFAINDTTFQRYYYVGGLVAAITLLASRFHKRRNFEARFSYVFAAITITWFITAHYLIALISLVLLVLQYLSSQQLELQFYEDKIVSPGPAGRTLSWNAFANVILKDGLLTLDYKNNRISQYLVEDGIDLPNEKDFNEFCRKQLSTAGAS